MILLVGLVGNLLVYCTGLHGQDAGLHGPLFLNSYFVSNDGQPAASGYFTTGHEGNIPPSAFVIEGARKFCLAIMTKNC